MVQNISTRMKLKKVNHMKPNVVIDTMCDTIVIDGREIRGLELYHENGRWMLESYISDDYSKEDIDAINKELEYMSNG